MILYWPCRRKYKLPLATHSSFVHPHLSHFLKHFALQDETNQQTCHVEQHPSVNKDVRRRASYLVALLQYLMMRVRKQQAARMFPWQHSQPKRYKNTNYKTRQKTHKKHICLTAQLLLLPTQRENKPKQKQTKHGRVDSDSDVTHSWCTISLFMYNLNWFFNWT